MLMLIVLLFPLILFVVRKFYLNKFKSGNNVCVLVLGDIGRSPRMQYHAISFAREGFTVDVIGYPGSSPIREISENARIQIHYLRLPPELRNSTNWILLLSFYRFPHDPFYIIYVLICFSIFLYLFIDFYKIAFLLLFQNCHVFFVT